jgi:hypothetical protein
MDVAARDLVQPDREGRVVTEPLPMKAFQRQLKLLVDDLREQSTVLPELQVLLDEQYAGAFGHRTGASFEEWREEQLDQAAVAWLLGTVFVRFCEDNELISGAWLAGPDGRTGAAVQAQTAYFLKEPKHNDRHWILAAFKHLRKLSATAGIFDDHNPVWNKFDISADAAAALLDFWRRGPGARSFVDEHLDTRFLGDLYQDLSEEARKRYALLQTPEFVEEFILDLTLTPSIADYGLEETSVIDPTCGSGHFLLGAFHRLDKLWRDKEPATDPRVRVQKALDQVTGVDVNPFAVAIAKFRLLVAALQASGERSLESAPGFRLRLAAGDSLLRWGVDSSHQGDLLASLDGRDEYPYFTEDAGLLADYLERGQYTVAVGNPPYITVKDRILNDRYRRLYDSCTGLYSLSVPFVERFFELVARPDESRRAGYVGQITAKSFTKRDFGRKLIESYLCTRVELSHIIDTGGAYIPGHGTPTIILVGRRRQPIRSTIRTLFGLRGEPVAPNKPAAGLVWESIISSVDSPGARNQYVSVQDVPRESFASHPWSLSSSDSRAVMNALESTASNLGQLAVRMGFFGMTHADDLFVLSAGCMRRHRLSGNTREGVSGDDLRDWSTRLKDYVFFPYNNERKLLDERELSPSIRCWMWPFRSLLWARTRFGGSTYREDGVPWFAWHQVPLDRDASPISLAYAFVATHNHAVVDRSGMAFRQSAPLIKMRPDVSEADLVGLLGILNSSAICFWLKQVNHDMGGGGIGGGLATEDWEHFYQFNATRFADLPIPMVLPVKRAERLESLSKAIALVLPSAVAPQQASLTRDRLDDAHTQYHSLRSEMIAVQEELDWQLYHLYGLLEDLTVPEEFLPVLSLGERAFEIVLARKVASGELKTEWFVRHDSVPITEIPAHWPEAYRAVVERRIRVIEERPDIALIERPECKRRWASSSWEAQEKEALRDWLLNRLETETLWRDNGRARVLSVAQLADRVGVDPDFRGVLALYCGRDDYDLAAEVTKLVAEQAVPFLAVYRYKASGLRKREQWERTWDLQRREDEGEKMRKPIPVPPKYAGADFAKVSYWRNRGKLDVPKERFIAYPKAGRDADKTPVIGWAGWNHLDQAQALATLYINRKTDEGWLGERLLPLLAGLVELEPWLYQWYSDPAPHYPGSPAAFYTTLIDTELSSLGYGRADLAPEKLS